jgi:hypothetical protein
MHQCMFICVHVVWDCARLIRIVVKLAVPASRVCVSILKHTYIHTYIHTYMQAGDMVAVVQAVNKKQGRFTKVQSHKST